MGFVQSASNSGSGTSTTVTLGSNTTVGNCLIGMGGSVGAADAISGITIGGSADNWASANAQTTTSCAAGQWTDQNCQQNATAVVFSFAGSSTSHTAYCIEWNGVATSGAVDKTNHGALSSSSSFSSGSSGTLTQANEVAFGYYNGESESANQTLTGPSSPWTNLTQVNVSTSVQAIGGYQAVSATTALTYAGSASGTQFVGMALITTLKLSGSITVSLPLLTINTASGTLNPPLYIDLPLLTINTAVNDLTPGIGIVINLPLLTINTADYALTPHITPSVVVDLPLLTINTASHPYTPDITPVPPKLLIAIAARAGTDPYAGYTYPEGFTQFESQSQYVNILSGIISLLANVNQMPSLIQTLDTAGFLDLLSGGVNSGDTQSEIFLESRESGGGTATVAVNTDAFQVNASETASIDAPNSIDLATAGVTIGNGSSAQLALSPKMAQPTNLALINGGTATAAQICAFLASWYGEFQNRGMAT